MLNRVSRDEFCIDARELHGKLGVGKPFPTWIKDIISKHFFMKDEDFKNPIIPNHRGQEYFITPEMAKVLATFFDGNRDKRIEDFLESFN